MTPVFEAKPLRVEAMQWLPAVDGNLQALRAWGATVQALDWDADGMPSAGYLEERPSPRLRPTDWIVKDGQGFVIYSAARFEASFQAAEPVPPSTTA